MNTRPAESLKPIANSLAELISASSKDLERMTGLLEQLPSLATGNAGDTEQKPVDPSREVKEIGIWKKCIENNMVLYERDVDKNIDWPLWANMHRIYPKKDNKRVLLLGESVARGYFYDPYYTVASELEGILQNLPGMRGSEVIDLARTNLRMDGLAGLVRDCHVLEPDAVILFAGNNWFPNLRDSIGGQDYKLMYQLFREGSFDQLKPFLEKRFGELIRSFLGEVAANLGKRNIPVVFVIPGFNLKDWKSDHIGKSLPWLPGDAVPRWLEARDRAEWALTSGQTDVLGQSAGEMVAIDPFNPHGYELLAEYYMKNRRWTDAQKCLESCRDAILVNRGGNNHPRCFGIIRDTILAGQKEYGISVVDSPRIFNEFMREGVPDRHLFFDYCHLTIEGIRLSMRHTASALMQATSGVDIPAEEIKDSGTDPGRQVKAIAHFCAAIHNGHNDQSSEIVRYHCRKALSYTTEVKAAMFHFIDFASRYTSTILCSTFGEVILNGKMKQYEGGFALRPPKGRKLMDIKLVDAITGALDAVGIHVDDEVARLRMQEHLVAGDKVNLMESFYSTTTYQDFLIGEPTPSYLQARSTESPFMFIADGKSPLFFELVYRNPKSFSQELSVRIVVNGREDQAIELPMSKKWLTRTFLIPPALLREGVNNLTIKWPYIPFPPEEMEDTISPTAFLNALLPVLAEIHSFTTMVASEELIPERVSIKNL